MKFSIATAVASAERPRRRFLADSADREREATRDAGRRRGTVRGRLDSTGKKKKNVNEELSRPRETGPRDPPDVGRARLPAFAISVFNRVRLVRFDGRNDFSTPSHSRPFK